jgi:phosphate transport system permease protein
MAITTTVRSLSSDVAGSLRRGRVDVAGTIFSTLLRLALLASVLILGVLVVDVVTGGWSVLSTRYEDFMASGLGAQPDDSGLAQAIRGTFFIGVFTVVISFPLGVGAAVYLEEYASKGPLSRFIDVNIRNLAGVPSVVYGILGLTIFVKLLGGVTGPDVNGRSVISAGLTLAILVLPLVIITAAEAIRAVPAGIREAGYGVGATRSEVVRHHVIPYAAPGILTGTVLALARALGEAAPLILVGAVSGYMTGGSAYSPASLQGSFTALPIAITTWAGRPGAEWRAVTSAGIVILLLIVLAANAGAILARNRYEKRRA